MNSPAILPARRERADGWTPVCQRIFLGAIAGGSTVEFACACAGLSPSSAYALRRHPAGAAFAIGWSAANLLAREKLSDTLLARALEGQTETVTRPDGSVVERHRFDNRLATTLLARLDREADAQSGSASGHAARLVAQEFEAYLDLISRDEGPARAGLFLGSRAASEPEADLAPVVALARADRFIRAQAGLPGEVDLTGLDPARRDEWTAEQWARAEAAGLLQLAAPADIARRCEVTPLNDEADEASDELDPVWWDEDREEWMTCFPLPEGEYCEEVGEYGDEDYSRTLTDEEKAAREAVRRAELAPLRAVELLERDRWFGLVEEEEEDRVEEEGSDRAEATDGDGARKGDPVGKTQAPDTSPPGDAGAFQHPRRRTGGNGGAVNYSPDMGRERKPNDWRFVRRPRAAR